MIPRDRKLAKTKNVLDLPIVEVMWKDATSFHGWYSLESVRTDVPDECRTVGRLVRCDKKFVSVVQSVTANGKLCENWVIPRPWVLKIARLKMARSGRKRR